MRPARSLLAAAILALLAGAPPLAAAQGKTYRFAAISISVGVAPADATANRVIAFLAKEGFVEGRNLTFLRRFGTPEQLPRMMRELLAFQPDVILAVGAEAIRVASNATSTIPIVAFGPDPVALGVAESIARPGRNVTGVVILPDVLDGKRLQLLHEALRGTRRLAALVHPTSPNREGSEREMRAAALGASVDLRLFYATGPPDYAAAFAAMRANSVAGAVIFSNPEYYRDRALIIRHALAARLPTICQWSEMAAEGCMLSYGPPLEELRARVAYLIARILNGAKPADLPIEQPSKVELVVNLKVAKTLGVAIPESVLARANEVIE